MRQQFKNVPGIGIYNRWGSQGGWRHPSTHDERDLTGFAAVSDVVPVILPPDYDAGLNGRYEKVTRLAELCRQHNGDVAVDAQVLLAALRDLLAEQRR